MAQRPAALVTGASRGIGRAIAEELGRLKYAVVVNYVKSSDAAAEVAANITAAGGEGLAVKADVADAHERRILLDETLASFGRLDVLVNNAAISSPGRAGDMLDASEDSWDRVFAVNLKGPFFLAQAAARAMIDLVHQGTIASAKIVNISSISGFTASPNRPDYCMAKAGLQMMTGILAQRLAEEKIQVFDVCPGVIASDMTAPVHERYEKMIAQGAWPIRRWGQPEDVARAVSAIVQDYFPFSTGERIHVDGGFHVRTL